MIDINEGIFEELSSYIQKFEDNINIDILKDDILINFKGWYQVDWIKDDDYFTGTGSIHYTYCNINFICTCSDESENWIKNNYSDEKFEKFLMNT